ncbi:biotin-dependent carboxyltransferase family protein [Pandoraea sp.]|uniref:5-oxoprolinase subunit C family protein n=1 Tax=Pandoraea sp. TaxID=1883445 RepID=UPI001219DD94|nr:biotin-dependent carboxyltransferase family protein [Pandoraea sp.]TAL56894.1 MAG: biotin-dependent carboxyltransferase family protein [Pandoraea sp.]TAM17688.1 MAG: biotin-dependent carboxyltransferase family protein [Pandoraea sp.]
MSIEVIKPGMLTTFQDLGRAGYQHLGVPVNGAMDERSHRLANLLAGNASTEATLEVTLMGPTLQWHAPATIVICGADLQPSVDDQPIPMYEPVPVAAGAVLAFGKRRNGVRAYLAVRGGFALAPVMGSASTYVRGGYGGLRGEPLRRGDVIALRGAPQAARRAVKGARATALPVLPPVVLGSPDAPLRALAGREWSMFSAQAQRNLVAEPFRIDPQSDRMGYRLAGLPLELGAAREMISEAVGFGTIQVPPDGQPIVLMADRQTTGGYPKIAHVCAVDLPRLAQKMPGETVHFQLIDLDEAQRLMLLQEAAFAAAGEQ